MKKLVILFLILFVTSGCTIDYEIYYKNKKNVQEKVSIGVEQNVINDYSNSAEDYFYEIFNGWKQSYDLKKYKYDVKTKARYSYINLIKNHDSIKELLENEILDQIFSTKDVYEKDNNIMVTLSDYVYATAQSEMYLESNDSDMFTLSIKFKSNYKVECNADEKNNFTGTYIWHFDKNSLDKKINIKLTEQLNLSAFIINNSFILILLGITLIGLIGYIIIKKIIKRKNMINEL